MSLINTQLGRLRLVAFAEGVSFLILLFITMPLKYLFQLPEPNLFFGMAHGLLFVLYVLAVVQITIEKSWNMKKMFLALLASVIPFGTFWADKKLFKPEAAHE
jgi:integral membrane protein